MKQEINNTIQFLQRVDLKWNEVPAFIECIKFLNNLAKDTETNNIKEEEVNS